MILPLSRYNRATNYQRQTYEKKNINYFNKGDFLVYSIAKNVRLKKDILLFLDQETEYVSTQELAEGLYQSSLSVSTLYKLCNELKLEIESLYTSEELQLIISSRHGLKLERKNATFQPLLEKLFVSDPIYTILKEVFQNKQLNTAHFCIVFHMSESQLRRRIKQLNEWLNRYYLHISVSKKITLRGDDYRFRHFYFEFLFFVHHRLSNIEWIDKPTHYLNRSRYLARQLDYPTYGDKLEVLALWFYVNDYSNESFSLPKPTKELIPNFSMIKPDYLKNWTDDAWHYFLSFLYASNLFDAQLEVTNEQSTFAGITPTVELWLDLFEKHFHTSSPLVRTHATELLRKNFIKERIFLSNPMPFDFSDADLFKDIQNNYPRYYKVFSQFYNEYLLTDSQNELNLSTRKAFLICIDLISMRINLPKIKVYFNSSYNSLKNTFNMDRIQAHFSNRVDLIWSSELENSDLLISTSNNIDFDVDCNIETAIINKDLAHNDLLSIENKINKLLLKRYSSPQEFLLN